VDQSRATLFFFGGYQGTVLPLPAADRLRWVPTPAMLRRRLHDVRLGGVQRGRQVPLRAPFVDNRSIHPSSVQPR